MAITKRLAAPVFMPVERKTAKYVVSSRTGTDKIPLAVIVRDVLHYAKNYKEASKIIKGGQMLVDGLVRKDPAYGVGLMDVLTIDFKSYRVVPSKKGLVIVEITDNEAKRKLVRVDGKKTISEGKMQLNLHDGSNVLHKENIPTHDVLVISLPEKKIQKVLSYKIGNLAVVTKGRNAGTVGVIKEIQSVQGVNVNKVFLDVSGKVVEFPEDYIFIVGEEDLQVTATKSD